MKAISIKQFIAVCVLSVMGFVVAGCMKVSADLTVNSDDTISGKFTFGLNKMILAFTEQTEDEFIADMMKDAQSDIDGEDITDDDDLEDLSGPDLFNKKTKDVTVEPYKSGQFIGVSYKLTHVPFDEMNSEEDDFTIKHEHGRYIFNALLDLRQDEEDQDNESESPTVEEPSSTLDQSSPAEESPLEEEETAEPDIFPDETESSDEESAELDKQAEELLKTAEIDFKITFPGKVISSNGKVSGNSVKWSPEFNEVAELKAEAEEGDQKADEGSSFLSSKWPWILGGIGAIVIISGITVLAIILRKRRQNAINPLTSQAQPWSGYSGQYGATQPPYQQYQQPTDPTYYQRPDTPDHP